MKLHILKVLYGLESHAKDGRCGLSRNEDIRQFVGKLVEKQTLSLELGPVVYSQTDVQTELFQVFGISSPLTYDRGVSSTIN